MTLPECLSCYPVLINNGKRALLLAISFGRNEQVQGYDRQEQIVASLLGISDWGEMLLHGENCLKKERSFLRKRLDCCRKRCRGKIWVCNCWMLSWPCLSIPHPRWFTFRKSRVQTLRIFPEAGPQMRMHCMSKGWSPATPSNPFSRLLSSLRWQEVQFCSNVRCYPGTSSKDCCLSDSGAK